MAGSAHGATRSHSGHSPCVVFVHPVDPVLAPSDNDPFVAVIKELHGPCSGKGLYDFDGSRGAKSRRPQQIDGFVGRCYGHHLAPPSHNDHSDQAKQARENGRAENAMNPETGPKCPARNNERQDCQRFETGPQPIRCKEDKPNRPFVSQKVLGHSCECRPRYGANHGTSVDLGPPDTGDIWGDQCSKLIACRNVGSWARWDVRHRFRPLTIWTRGRPGSLWRQQPAPPSTSACAPWWKLPQSRRAAATACR